MTMDKEEQLKLAQEKSKTTNLGNTNSNKKNRLLKNTLNRIVTQDDAKRARNMMEALVSKAEEGDTRALDIVLDRLEGKVQSQTDIISSDGSLQSNLKIEFVDAADPKISE
tara:strand:- start:3663 stop:3995 length:333 start_codon:yes stop_codon:yes gene_type:complete